MKSEGQSPLASAGVADARDLPFDQRADAALLFGPMYHLTERGDRLAALVEARRVLDKGAPLFVAAISFAASTLAGLASRLLEEKGFEAITERDIRDGQHRNPHEHPFFFTTSYFHRPEELEAELRETGFDVENVVAVEGPAQLLRDIDHWLNDETRTQLLLDAIRRVESEPTLIGATAHLIAVARPR